VIAVVGQGEPDAEIERLAEEVGALAAAKEWVLLCGGRGGVMSAAARGCTEHGGLAIGLLPGPDRSEANPWLGVALPTGLGQARNAVIAQACEGMVAVGGGPGTLSEVALALKSLKPVVGLRFPYGVPGVRLVQTPSEAMEALVQQGLY
jgi:uncharacterized protein (TIGR00725 family)